MDSIWTRDVEIPAGGELKDEAKTEVLIIGGGMAGILTAYMLQKQGVNCMLIERNKLLRGVTSNTTAKVTAQHGAIYSQIEKHFSSEKAIMYGVANRQAVEMYEKVINKNQIACDFEKISTYLYTSEPDNIKILEKENAQATQCGFQVELTEKTSLPLPVKCALKMNNQAQFHPLKFAAALAEKIRFYENIQALDIDDENNVITDHGKITAQKIVVTTHFPFFNRPGYYFLRMHQERSYVIAFENALQVDGPYLGIDAVNHSFRNFNGLLFVGGSGHRTGENPNGDRYSTLLRDAKNFYPQSSEVCRWSAQDCMTHDGIPYIGQLSKKMDNIFVATGFNKWGMTSSMVSAMILSDQIAGHKNPNAEVFSPQRHNWTASTKSLVVDSKVAVTNLNKQIFTMPKETIEAVPVEWGGVIEFQGAKVGLYKPSYEEAHIVLTRCPHLGCQLAWNQDELSWDCPCHGSRFSFSGENLDNPAQTGLEHEKILL